MIDRVASHMLGELTLPMSKHQMMHVGIALLQVWTAIDFWNRANKGTSITLKPWMLRTGAVVAGASALWAIYNARVTNGTHPVQAVAAAPAVAPAPGASVPVTFDPRMFA